MKSHIAYLVPILSFLSALTTAAPFCDKQIYLAKDKRRVVHVTRTVATVSSTSTYYTSTHTLTAPLVEVLVSSDLTYTLTLTTAVPTDTISEGQTLTSTTTISSGVSMDSAIASADRGNSNAITRWATSTSSVPSETSAAAASSDASAVTSGSNTEQAAANSSAQQQTSFQTTATGNIAESANAAHTISALATTFSSAITTSGNYGSSSSAEVSSSAVSDYSTTGSSVEYSVASSAGQTSFSASPTSTTFTESFVAASSAPSATNSKAVSTVIPAALAYSPYNDDGTCKDYSTVSNDLTKIAAKSIPTIRVYGNDCNYLSTVIPLARDLGLKVNQGIWFSSTDMSIINKVTAALIAYANSVENGWDIFEFITIGNEPISSGYMTISQLFEIIESVKRTLQNGGYTGQFTTSEPPVTFENHPELCTGDYLDFVSINPHSYFNPSINASQAGDFVFGQKQMVEKICTGKTVIVTETGYPSQGDTNGLNIPSTENQKIAIKSILDVMGSDVTILTMYNDMWKHPGDYGIEQYFGVYDILN